MPNTLLTPVMITREALRVLHNNLVFVKAVNRQYSSEFAVSGAKIGSTVNVRKPNRYFVRKGPVMSTQNTTETFVPLTITTQWGVDINFTSAELALSLDDFSKRILTPACARIAAQIDFDGLGLFTDIYNQVGTPGQTPGTTAGAGLLQSTTPIVFLNSGVVLDNNATPRDESRRILLNPTAMAQSVQGLSGLWNDQETVGEQYKKGVLGKALGFEFAMDQNINLFTTGTHGGTPVVSAAGQTGASLLTSGWTALATVLKKGDIFTIALVNGVNPENQQSTGGLQYFVATADVTADAGGLATIPISPSIKLAGTNIADGTVTALPAFGAALTLMSGAASTQFPQNLAYHKYAFTFASVDLPLPGGVDFAARETYDGISMRIVRAFDINNDQMPCRIDVLGGFATLRPELACRITG